MRVYSIADVAATVRGRRVDQGLSQAELAQRASVSRKWVSEFEAGKPAVEFSLVIRVLEELGITLDLGVDHGALAMEPAPGAVDLDALLEEHRGG